jgi:hypothetical protein
MDRLGKALVRQGDLIFDNVVASPVELVRAIAYSPPRDGPGGTPGKLLLRTGE